MKSSRNIAKIDYHGKDLYVGIDVHKKKWVVTVRTYDMELKTYVLTSPSAARLHQSLEKHFAGGIYHLVYESGFSGYGLYDYFTERGIEIIVTPPNRIPRDGNRVKTDRIDSRKLAYLLSRGMLKRVKVAAKDVREMRLLFRELDNLQKQRQQVRNFIRSSLHFLGHELKDSHWNAAFLKRLQVEALVEGIFQEGLRLLIAHYNAIEERIKELKAYLREVWRGSRYRGLVERISRIRGIGEVSAFRLVVFLFDRIDRFESSGSVAHYVGLTPREHSSGGKERRGGITRYGDRRLRWLLVQLSWQVVRHDVALQEKFERILRRGSSSQKAIVAVARKLVVRLYRIYVNDEEYVSGVAA